MAQTQLPAALSAQLVWVSNTTLFALASQFYGDAMQWVVLARANGLIDPQVAGSVQLVVPRNANSLTGGILGL